MRDPGEPEHRIRLESRRHDEVATIERLKARSRRKQRSARRH